MTPTTRAPRSTTPFAPAPCAAALATVALLLAAAPAARAQTPAAPATRLTSPAAPLDTARLDALRDAAERRDPRARQLALRRAQSALRLRTIAAERLPALGANANAQYQSVVTTFPGGALGGAPQLPHDSYDAHLSAQEPLLDPTRGARANVERAQLAQTESQLRSTLYTTRAQVNGSFFAAAALAARLEALATSITDLEAQESLVTARVRGGTALPGEAAAIRAERLRRRQDEDELGAERGAALAVLGDLTGERISPDAVLLWPDLAPAVARARAELDTVRARPEFERFARSRELLARQEAALGAQDLPRVSAFARAGSGRPGLNLLSTTFEPYWLGGVQVQWTPWNWGRTSRDREALRVERDVVETEEAAFRDALRRAVVSDLAAIDRLERALASDDEIIALRERIARETGLRLREGVVTAAEYVDRQTDLLAARVARGAHRVALAQARASFLTTLGLEVR